MLGQLLLNTWFIFAMYKYLAQNFLNFELINFQEIYWFYIESN